jgi:5-deoxy-glucuronate isomerase
MIKKLSGPKPSELKKGITPILSGGKIPEVGISFAVWKLGPRASAAISSEVEETAVLAFSGRGSLGAGGKSLSFSRKEWIHTCPVVVHSSAGDIIQVKNAGDEILELFVVQTANSESFAARCYEEKDILVEHRGRGILDDTCYRMVRRVFDDANGPPESRLVLGETINMPGRWSSYPPHFHPQPEIYYYRFSHPQGYGHGELGEEIFRIEEGDLLLITESQAHVQTSAPGYAMYYLWAIRHLEGNRYTGFAFDPAHAWTLTEGGEK